MIDERLADQSTSASDSALMRDVSQGSVAALETIFDRYVDRVYTLCFRLTGDRDAADDLTQETFVRVWASAQRFRGESSLATWLYRVVYNLGVDRERRLRTGQAAVERMQAQLKLVRLELSGPEESARAAIVEAALAKLEPEDRAVLVMTRYHGLSYADVAPVIGCSAAAARVRAHRALRQLRTICLAMEKKDHDLRSG